MRLKRRPPRSQPERTKPSEDDLLGVIHLEMERRGVGSLGEWLFRCMSEPFGFVKPWGAPGAPNTAIRRKYDRAARAFARQLMQALAESERTR